MVSLKFFVANRVADIQWRSDPALWWHIPRKKKPHWRRNKRSGPEKHIRWRSLVPGICFSTYGGDTVAFIKSRDCSEEGKHELVKIYLTSQCKQSLRLLDIEKFLPGAAVENGIICWQWWNHTRRRETKNFQSTLQWQKPCRIISSKKRRI